MAQRSRHLAHDRFRHLVGPTPATPMATSGSRRWPAPDKRFAMDASVCADRRGRSLRRFTAHVLELRLQRIGAVRIQRRLRRQPRDAADWRSPEKHPSDSRPSQVAAGLRVRPEASARRRPVPRLLAAPKEPRRDIVVAGKAPLAADVPSHAGGVSGKYRASMRQVWTRSSQASRLSPSARVTATRARPPYCR